MKRLKEQNQWVSSSSLQQKRWHILNFHDWNKRSTSPQRFPRPLLRSSIPPLRRDPSQPMFVGSRWTRRAFFGRTKFDMFRSSKNPILVVKIAARYRFWVQLLLKEIWWSDGHICPIQGGNLETLQASSAAPQTNLSQYPGAKFRTPRVVVIFFAALQPWHQPLSPFNPSTTNTKSQVFPTSKDANWVSKIGCNGWSSKPRRKMVSKNWYNGNLEQKEAGRCLQQKVPRMLPNSSYSWQKGGF